jgi:hypothetical protein
MSEQCATIHAGVVDLSKIGEIHCIDDEQISDEELRVGGD